MKQQVIWLGAIILAIGAWYILADGVQWHQKGMVIARNPELKTVDFTDSAANYDIVAKYPQFGIAAFDARIKQAVDEAVTEIENAAAPDPATYKNALDVRFFSPYIGPDILSVKLVLTQYTGGAHPMTGISGLNYDLARGVLLTLDDVLPMTGLTLQQVSEQATVHLKTKLSGAIFPEGVSAKPENFSSFAVSKDAVTFIFQPYQVAAYAAGVQEVSFPRVR